MQKSKKKSKLMHIYPQLLLVSTGVSFLLSIGVMVSRYLEKDMFFSLEMILMTLLMTAGLSVTLFGTISVLPIPNDKK